MMQDLKTGSLLRQLRREKGWTQRQVAEQLGVSAQAVSKWERDLGCPDVGLLSPPLRDLLRGGGHAAGGQSGPLRA